MKMRIVVAMMIILFITPAAYAAAAINLTTDRTTYAPGETIIWKTTSLSNGNNNKVYELKIYYPNDTVADTVTGTTTGNLDSVPMFISWVVPLEYPATNNSYGNFTHTALLGGSNRAYFNTSSIPANKLVISEMTELYNGDWKFDEVNSISAVVKNYLGQEVVGAECKLDIVSATEDEPFYVIYGGVTGARGLVIFPVLLDFSIFDIGEYVYTVSCRSTTESFVSSLNSTVATTLSGFNSGIFDITEHVLINEIFLDSRLNTTKTQTEDGMCINVTNNYRNYTATYVVNYHLLCDVPNQDVKVVSGSSEETLGPQQEATFCRPFVFPETSAQGTGYCRIHIGVDPVDAVNDLSGDFSDSSELFYVEPSFTKTLDSRKISQTEYRVVVTMPKDAVGTARTMFPKEFTDVWNLDEVRSIIAEYNGTNYTAHSAIGRVSREDAGGASTQGLFARVAQVVTEANVTFVANQNITLYITVESEANFWQSVIAALNRIADAFESFVGGGFAEPVGNYTSVVSQLVSTDPLKTNHTVTVSGSGERRNLHFVYEFAPINASIEGAFKDQNPSIEGYQALSAYQSVQLNSTKSFELTLYPNLVVGEYAMYETIYEVDGVQAVSSGNFERDERIVSQKRYELNVTQDRTPEFDGAVVQFNGVVMQSFG